jgi:hypothetical protein
MADELTGGGPVFPENENSMAAAIERRLNDLLLEAGFDKLPIENTSEARDRRRMFAAIARGVIDHLASNPTALRVHITQAPGGNASQYEGHVHVDWRLLP